MPIYIAGNPDGDLHRIDDDGGNDTLLNAAGSGANLRSVAVDLVHNKIWVSDYVTSNGTDGLINTYNLDGTGEATIISGADAYQPNGLSIDPVNSKVYYTSRKPSSSDRVLFRANLDGTSIETLSDPGATLPQETDIDVAGGKIYWNEGAAILRADLDGSNIETIWDGTDGIGSAFDIALDIPTGEIYWCDTTPAPDEIHKGKMDGSGSTTLIVAEDKLTEITIDSAGGRMYWDRAGDKVLRGGDLDGTNISTIVSYANAVLVGIQWAPEAGATGARKTFWGPWYYLSGPGSSFGQSLPK